MSNSQEQSLNENAVFLPVDESNPEFLYCEREREAVERLMSGGPEAFYSSIGSERSSCFLSPEEVSQISSWTQNYHFNQVEEKNGEEDNSVESEDFCSTYFPCHSDVPIPNLDLGWPARPPWVLTDSVTVLTSPPGEPSPVREVIRRYLQNAKQVIAIVTDKLTDNVIISDLHSAASRGVPVYITLNQRSLQGNFTLSKLRHPNMRVRVLRGKTFSSRTGRIVVGEMKSNFLLVDLETVIHGSYSLTWMDTHLHRQLVTILRGPVVDLFDQEFKILYAASVPASDTGRVAAGIQVKAPHQTTVYSDFRSLKHQPEIINPPSPSADVFLDWEAMGVVQRDNGIPGSSLDLNEEFLAEKLPQKTDNDKGILDILTYNGHLLEDKKGIHENPSRVTTRWSEKPTTFNNSESLSSNSSATERILRLENNVEKRLSSKLSAEKGTSLKERTRTNLDKTPGPTNVQASASRRLPLRWETFLEEESTMNEVSEASKLSSRKPLILSIPQNESFSSLSNIMKRIKMGTPGLLSRGRSPTVLDRAQSMMDLSDPCIDLGPKEKRGVPVPRFLGSLDPDHMTPALALMKKRNNAIQAALSKPPRRFSNLERTHNSMDINEYRRRFNIQKEEQKW